MAKKHNEEINSKLRNDHFNSIITSITNNKIDELEGFICEDSHFLLRINVDKLFDSLNKANNKTTSWVSDVLLRTPYDVYKQYDINNFHISIRSPFHIIFHLKFLQFFLLLQPYYCHV